MARLPLSFTPCLVTLCLPSGNSYIALDPCSFAPVVSSAWKVSFSFWPRMHVSFTSASWNPHHLSLSLSSQATSSTRPSQILQSKFLPFFCLPVAIISSLHGMCSFLVPHLIPSFASAPEGELRCDWRGQMNSSFSFMVIGFRSGVSVSSSDTIFLSESLFQGMLHSLQQGSLGWQFLLLVRLPSRAWLDYGVRSRASRHH